MASRLGRSYLTTMFLGLSVVVPAKAENRPKTTAFSRRLPPPLGYRYVPIQLVPKEADGQATELPYRKGHPIPAGYHLEEHHNRLLRVGGYILTGVSYGLGALVAAGFHFDNAAGYLMVPLAGPWLTMGLRHYSCKDQAASEAEAEQGGFICLGDGMTVLLLATDGVLQVVGGSMLLGSYLSSHKTVVRNRLAWTIGPRRFETGYGLGATGEF